MLRITLNFIKPKNCLRKPKLPAVLRQSPTLVMFKKQLKKWIYDSVHQFASK